MSAATKLSQILTIEPENELVFRGPFKDVVTTILKLTNPSNEVLCFKVKTTAPKRYCVRPNCGLIKPDESVNVAVMLQPFDYKDSSENKRHKFLVQSIISKEEMASGDVEAFWKNLVDTTSVMDSKLKCVFEFPTADNAGAAPPESSSSSPPKEKSASTKENIADSPASNRPATENVERRKTSTPSSSEAKESPAKPIQAPKQVEPEIRQRVTATKSSPPQDKPTVPSYQNKPKDVLPPELSTTDNTPLQTTFIVGIVLALILGIILGKYVL